MKKIFAACLLLVVALSGCRLFIPEPNDFPPRPTATETVVSPKATDVPTIPITPVSGAGYPTIVFRAREMLASKMGLNVEKIEVVKVEPVDWPDSCLGISTPGIMCSMIVTPGYRIVLRTNNMDYEYHTDAGDNVVFASLSPAINP